MKIHIQKMKMVCFILTLVAFNALFVCATNFPVKPLKTGPHPRPSPPRPNVPVHYKSPPPPLPLPPPLHRGPCPSPPPLLPLSPPPPYY
ncbi:hypothetical protein RND81_04G193000 [Saponaria officinalis]|uniref:Uncharacterized protein n=1 Tax=Saponaria officinalis TaxID=3572 RepID=A0AAW1LNQ8_SAPOF